MTAVESSANNLALCDDLAHKPVMPRERLEAVFSWGRSQRCMSYVYRPATVDAIRDIFKTARERGLSVALRGAGCSYGDASLNSEQIIMDLTRMNRVLDYDPVTGIITAEPGVTLRNLWRYALQDGWWPYVVSGTMHTTLGGTAAMNIHGKNNFAVGTIGDHILEFDLLLTSGELITCSRDKESELFHAAIGGFGVLGCFTRIVIQLKRVHSGNVRVKPIPTGNLDEMISTFESQKATADYLVGWVDCFGKGKRLGRGLMHRADYLNEGDDPQPAQTLRVEYQELPETILGIIPRSITWRLAKPMVNNVGMQIINAAKYYSSYLPGHGAPHLQSHAAFAFLLDYVPHWKRSYGPGGLIQYQSFIPADRANHVFRQQIELQHECGVVSYLGVMKRHKSDPFLMTHGLDGFSLALDFRVTPWNRDRLWTLTAKMDRLVTEAGGRFYFAKDSTLASSRLEDYLNEPRVQRFLELKTTLDPTSMLQTNLYRRIFCSGDERNVST